MSAVRARSIVRTWLSTHPNPDSDDIMLVLRGADVMAAFRGVIRGSIRGAMQSQRETK